MKIRTGFIGTVDNTPLIELRRASKETWRGTARPDKSRSFGNVPFERRLTSSRRMAGGGNSVPAPPSP